MPRLITVAAAQLGPIQRADSRKEVVARMIALLEKAKAQSASIGTRGRVIGSFVRRDMPMLATCGPWTVNRSRARTIPRAIDRAPDRQRSGAKSSTRSASSKRNAVLRPPSSTARASSALRVCSARIFSSTVPAQISL